MKKLAEWISIFKLFTKAWLMGIATFAVLLYFIMMVMAFNSLCR